MGKNICVISSFGSQTYDEIYDVIVNYINNYDIIKRKQVIKNFIYVSIVIIIGLIIYLFYSWKEVQICIMNLE